MDALFLQTATQSALRIPPFWSNDPILWFTHVKAQFFTHGIHSDAARLNHIVGSLSHEVMAEVRDFIMAPPGTVTYDTFRTELIRRTSDSKQRRLRQLLVEEELGDKRPTQLLRRMKQLMGETTLQPDILRQLFVSRLPATAQMILVSAGDSTPVEEIAELADRIIEVTTTVAPVIQTQASTNPFLSTPDSPELAELRDLAQQQARQIQLMDQLRAFTMHQPHQNGNQHFHRHLCYFHQRFREKARKCKNPCSYGKATTVTIRKRRFVDNTTGLTVSGIATCSSTTSPVNTKSTSNKGAKIPKRYSDIT